MKILEPFPTVCWLSLLFLNVLLQLESWLKGFKCDISFNFLRLFFGVPRLRGKKPEIFPILCLEQSVIFSRAVTVMAIIGLYHPLFCGLICGFVCREYKDLNSGHVSLALKENEAVKKDVLQSIKVAGCIDVFFSAEPDRIIETELVLSFSSIFINLPTYPL